MSVFPDDIFAADPLAAVIEEKTLQLKEGKRRNISILFADLEGFTEMSGKLDSEFVQTTIDKIMS
jgi:class 3 adenylate cyclase